MKKVLIGHLSKQKYLCATADVWSSRAISYLGVTIHFIEKETYQRESYVIGFKHLKHKQTYDVLASVLHEIFIDYDIKIGQLCNIVTDGGSAFCKMFKIYGKALDVVTYEEELNEQCELDEINDADGNSTTIFMEDAGGEMFVNNTLNFESDNSINEPNANSDNVLDANSEEEYFGASHIPEITDKIELPPQKRCISHICNLVPNDFRKKFLNGIAQTSLNNTLEKLNTLHTVALMQKPFVWKFWVDA